MTLAQIDGGVTAIVGCGGAEVLVSLLSLSDGMRRAARVAALSALETLAKGGEGACARVVVAGAMVPLRR